MKIIELPEGADAIVARTFNCEAALATMVAAKARYADYPARATIVDTGTTFDQIYLVIAGRARMLAFGIDGRLVVVDEFASGDIFGESGLFDVHVAEGEIAAVAAVTTGAFRNDVFIALMSSYTCIALAVSKLLLARLSAKTRRLVEGATLSTVGRIHAELLRQARSGEAMTIRPAPVLAAFALTVQSTRETVSRTIGALEKRGIIRRTADGLTVAAPHRLEELIY